MQIYPAIEILNGQCQGFKRGFENPLVSPVEMALDCLRKGATFIHLVDLDGSTQGHSVNVGVLKKIAYEIPVPLQLGGGIRNLQEMEYVLNCGMSRVIIGRAAVQNPGFVKEAIRLFSAKRVVVSITIKDNRVYDRHQLFSSTYSPMDFCKKMEQNGLKTIIIKEDSSFIMNEGPVIDFSSEVTRKTNLDVIVNSDKIYALKDLEHIKQAGIHGALVGKALTEHWIDLTRAIRLFQ